MHTAPISFSLVVQSSRWTGSFDDYCSNTPCIWVCDCVGTYVHAKSFDRMPVWKIIHIHSTLGDADGTFNKWPYGEVNDFGIVAAVPLSSWSYLTDTLSPFGFHPFGESLFT